MDETQELAAEVAFMVRALLASVDAGELSCSAAMRHRIEGAVLALESVLGPSRG